MQWCLFSPNGMTKDFAYHGGYLVRAVLARSSQLEGTAHQPIFMESDCGHVSDILVVDVRHLRLAVEGVSQHSFLRHSSPAREQKAMHEAPHADTDRDVDDGLTQLCFFRYEAWPQEKMPSMPRAAASMASRSRRSATMTSDALAARTTSVASTLRTRPRTSTPSPARARVTARSAKPEASSTRIMSVDRLDSRRFPSTTVRPRGRGWAGTAASLGDPRAQLATTAGSLQ